MTRGAALPRWVPLAGWAAVAGAVVLSMLYMMQTALANAAPKDFSYFWLAGQIWLDGGNPYAPEFSETANAIAAAHPDMTGLGGFHRWLYAPHIWGISVGLGSLDYVSARAVWAVLGSVATLAGCVVALASVLPVRHRLFGLALAPLLVLASVTIGSAMALSTGQIAPVTFLAVALFIFGLLRASRLAIVLALVVLTMKPNLAMPFIGFALVLPACRVPLLVAAGLSLMLAAPVALTTPVGEVVSGYLDGLTAYGGYRANSPIALTGLGNLIFAATGIALSGLVYAALGAAAGAAVALRVRIAGASPEALSVLLAVACLLVPLHLYDMTLIVLFLVLWPWPWWGGLALVGNLAILRVGVVGALAGLNVPGSRFPGSFSASLLIVVLFIAALVVWARRSGPPPGARR